VHECFVKVRWDDCNVRQTFEAKLLMRRQAFKLERHATRNSITEATFFKH